MAQFGATAEGSPDIPLDTIPGRLEDLSPRERNKLRKDVLRKSVDETREGGELAKTLKDVVPMAAAVIIAILLESLKEEEKSEKPDESKPEVAIATTSGKREVDTEVKSEKEPVKPKAVVRSPEVQNASGVVIIGDSIPKGMISKFKKGKKPEFIGEVGRSTPAILKDVKNNPKKLQGKKTAIISCGLNDLVWTDDYEEIVYRINEMVKECEEAKIEEIIVLTGFPFQSDFKRTKLRVRSGGFREVILERFREPRVKVVDLYKHFVDEEGNLKEQYASKGKDKLHPSKAYKDALKIIGRKSGTDLESLIG